MGTNAELLHYNYVYVIINAQILLQAEEHLRRGEVLDESFVAELIKERLNSSRIEHYGTCIFCYL